MTIHWSAEAIRSALLGGLLIGTGASILVLGVGRIAGISGITANLLPLQRSWSAWSAAFLFGLLCAPWAWTALGRSSAITFDVGWPVVVAGGFLVGLGTRIARGCTSGHGVCGIARWSSRSIAATITFMAFGVIAAVLLREVVHG